MRHLANRVVLRQVEGSFGQGAADVNRKDLAVGHYGWQHEVF